MPSPRIIILVGTVSAEQQLVARLVAEGATVSRHAGLLIAAFDTALIEAGALTLAGTYHRHDGAPPDLRFAARAVESGGDAVVAEGWGRYIAVLRGGGHVGVMRDPMGELPLLALTVAGGRAYVSHLSDALALGFRPQLLGDRLANASPVDPGEIDIDGRRRVLWAATSFAHRAPPRDPAAALRATLDRALALDVEHRPTGLLLSGGLDSSIVLGCLAAQKKAPAAALHLAPAPAAAAQAPSFAHFAMGAADERHFARTAAASAQVPLLEAERAVGDMLERWAEAPLSAAPSNYLFIADLGGIEKDFAERFGVSRLITGQAGDTILFNAPTPMIAADRFADGNPAQILRTIGDAARLSHITWWSAAAQAWRQRPPRGGLGPAKRRQIAQLARTLNMTAEDRPAGWLPLVNPLHAQPVVELCLSIPTWQLAENGVPRGLARRAFDDRLPAPIAARRAKAAGDAHLRAVVRAEAGFVRTFLGLAATPLLAPEALGQPAGAVAVIAAVAREGWRRQWATIIAEAP